MRVFNASSSCPVCSQGEVAFMKCDACKAFLLVCDECESIWPNPRKLVDKMSATGSYPICPRCDGKLTSKSYPTRQMIEQADYADLIIAEKDLPIESN